jgi:tRNA-dihydrouridine synthase
MVPSSQIVRAYDRARAVYLGVDRKLGQLNPEEILEVISRISENPGKEYQCRDQRDVTTLAELVGISGTVEHPVALQLGGNDPETLGMASLIGKAFGNYDSINLNCGCPSNAVGGRSGGAMLMKDPSHVARCLEAMNDSISSLAGAKESIVTVKHRLGVRDASTYDAASDRQKDDTESCKTCRTFVKTIALGGAVAKCHVHARIGLLGEFLLDEPETQTTSQRRQQLWVPGQKEPVTNEKFEKINHKREQERAKRWARQATIMNRDVPLLRPGVVYRLADEFPHLEFVTNGGIQTLSDVKKIVDDGLGTSVVGAMVGRAAINHPCAFASADALWEIRSAQGKTSLCRPTRGEVLHNFIAYCDREEEHLSSLDASPESIDILRRRLVAVPFHLFVGENGNDVFQRRVKKLTSRSMLIKASSILSGASLFLPAESLDKCVDDHVPWENIVGASFFLNGYSS